MFDTIPPDNRLGYFDQQLNQKRQVKLKTCADVYDYWRTFKRFYKKAPKDGVEFQVDYIDTGLALNEDVREKAPIALALHGAPGSYHDFALLIHHLSKQNVRVIAPNFPEYTATVKTKVLFRHSADEKAAYLRDFLRAINVNKIDLLVSHSSAIFPTLLILLNANNEAIKRQQQKQSRHQSNNQDNNNSTNQIKPFATIKTTTAMIKDDPDECCDTVAEGGEHMVWVNQGNSLKQQQTATTQNHDEKEDEKLDQAKGAGDGACTCDKCNDDVNDADSEEDKFEDAKDEIDSNNNNDNNREVTQPQQQQIIKTHLDERKKLGKKRNNVGRCKRRSSQDVIVKFDQPIEIKAVALFNPAGHRLPKSMKPTWFKCGSVRIYQHKLGRSLFRKLGPAFLTVVGVPVRVDNMDNVMLSATVMRNSKCHRVVQQLEQLSQMKLPTLLVFSENDKLIEKEIFYEMSKFMKLDHKNFDIFNNDGDIELSHIYHKIINNNSPSYSLVDILLKHTFSYIESLTDDWIRVMVFKAGGHYAYSNYAKTVNKAVSELLKKVVNEDDESPKTAIASC